MTNVLITVVVLLVVGGLVWYSMRNTSNSGGAGGSGGSGGGGSRDDRHDDERI